MNSASPRFFSHSLRTGSLLSCSHSRSKWRRAIIIRCRRSHLRHCWRSIHRWCVIHGVLHTFYQEWNTEQKEKERKRKKWWEQRDSCCLKKKKKIARSALVFCLFLFSVLHFSGFQPMINDAVLIGSSWQSFYVYTREYVYIATIVSNNRKCLILIFVDLIIWVAKSTEEEQKIDAVYLCIKIKQWQQTTDETYISLVFCHSHECTSYV